MTPPPNDPSIRECDAGAVAVLLLAAAVTVVIPAWLIVQGQPFAGVLMIVCLTPALGWTVAVAATRRRLGRPLLPGEPLTLWLRGLLGTAFVFAYLGGLALLAGSATLLLVMAFVDGERVEAFAGLGPSVTRWIPTDGRLFAVVIPTVLVAWTYGVRRVVWPLTRDWFRAEVDRGLTPARRSARLSELLRRPAGPGGTP